MVSRCKNKVEILAPCGSAESVDAALNCGADAVYIGGELFGARAYASNPDSGRLIELLDEVHLRGKKMYLTVNTLLKEDELTGRLIDYLSPFYAHGLDAVIVQDFGVMSAVRRAFPEMAIHASTQMTVVSAAAAEMLQNIAGIRRVVLARELSLNEIKKIRAACDIEIETFVHGALCYCYSGQCLMSSMIGGRSGNRGRCAQPCRLTYQFYANGNLSGKGAEGCLLSPKDICAIRLIPELVGAGIDSFKIEGRMKPPEYTAFVTAMYRKYTDLYFETGDEGFVVDEDDLRALGELYSRGGFSEGYYRQHNGRQMISVKKPNYSTRRTEQFDGIKAMLKTPQYKEKINAQLRICKDLPVRMTVTYDDLTVTVTGAVAVAALRRPITEADVRRQIARTGNTPYIFDPLEIEMAPDVFVPVSALNRLRRDAVLALQDKILEKHRRRGPLETSGAANAIGAVSVQRTCGALADWSTGAANASVVAPVRCAGKMSGMPALAVLFEDVQKIPAVISNAYVSVIYGEYLSVRQMGEERLREMIRRIHGAGKRFFLAMPHMLRDDGYIDKEALYRTALMADGALVRNLESLLLLRSRGYLERVIADARIYTWNRAAADFVRALGADVLTVPEELNFRELCGRGCDGEEMIVYGCRPLMISAQCLVKTAGGRCGRRGENQFRASERSGGAGESRETAERRAGDLDGWGTHLLRDRTGRYMRVVSHCEGCYHLIYNSQTLDLSGEIEKILRLSLGSLRLEFTGERAEEITEVLNRYCGVLFEGRASEGTVGHFTRGHWNRGVE